nr:MAG TPA: hypothetical protein [Caudoviricetes sp.]
MTSLIVGNKQSHSRLGCSQQRHQFTSHWQTFTTKYYRIPFDTFFLAGFRDCSLLELHLLVLSSYIALRALYVSIFQNNKPFFSLLSHTLLLCII